VLSREQEPVYLNAAPQPLKDLALLIFDTGLRDGEAQALKWPDVTMQPAPSAKFGYLQVQKGKSVQATTSRKPDRTSTDHAGSAPRKVFFGILVPGQER
jgi:integrase